ARWERCPARLETERRLAARRSAGDLLERAVEQTRYAASLVGGRGAERRLANVNKLVRLAREFEALHGRDLRAFLDHAADQARRGVREPDAPVEDVELDAI